MTARQPCLPAPGPLEDYAAAFGGVFPTLAQLRRCRAYLVGLLLRRDRNTTLTALAGAEPIVQAQVAPVHRLQRFLTEAAWDVAASTEARRALRTRHPVTQSHAAGVLLIGDPGDRKDGAARQYLRSVGKIDDGIVAVTTLWADA